MVTVSSIEQIGDDEASVNLTDGDFQCTAFCHPSKHAIGDVLTSTILANNLKKKYPTAVIDYMCYANCVDVLKNNPNITNIIVLEEKVRKNYLSLFQFIFNSKISIIIIFKFNACL